MKQQFPEPTAGALIFNPEGKLFLMKSHKWKNKYVIPGGHVELGETIEEALKREVKEETGMDIYDVKFIVIQDFVFGDEFWKKKHFIFIDCACRTNSTDIRLNSEGQEYKWFSLDNLPISEIEPYTLKAIEEYIKKYNKSSNRKI